MCLNIFLHHASICYYYLSSQQKRQKFLPFGQNARTSNESNWSNINIFMDDHYLQVFRSLVRDTRESYGYQLPNFVEQYVVMLLADHIDRPDWMPTNSFVEAYMLIKNSRDAKLLGDECLDRKSTRLNSSH